MRSFENNGFYAKETKCAIVVNMITIELPNLLLRNTISTQFPYKGTKSISGKTSSSYYQFIKQVSCITIVLPITNYVIKMLYIGIDSTDNPPHIDIDSTDNPPKFDKYVYHDIQNTAYIHTTMTSYISLRLCNFIKRVNSLIFF